MYICIYFTVAMSPIVYFRYSYCLQKQIPKGANKHQFIYRFDGLIKQFINSTNGAEVKNCLYIHTYVYLYTFSSGAT